MRIRKGVMTSTDENSSTVIPFFPYTMEDCIVSTVTDDNVKEVVSNPTEITDSGAAVARITSSVDSGNGRVIFRPNGEHKVILKLNPTTHSALKLTNITNGKSFNIDLVIPLKVDISKIMSVTCTAGIRGSETGTVILTGSGYNLYNIVKEYHVVVHGLLNVSGIDDAALKKNLCITVTIDYM